MTPESQLHGKILTLPTYLEVLSALSSIFGTELSSGKLATKTLEGFFRLAQLNIFLLNLQSCKARSDSALFSFKRLV
jgi:hypothetical protein